MTLVTPLRADRTTDAHAAPLRTVVAGTGRLGLQAASVLATHAGFALAGLVESRADLRGFARGCGFDAPVESRLAKLLPACDAVIVCAPPDARAALAGEAAAAGRAVLVAHPVSDSRDEARALVVRGPGRVSTFSPSAFHPLYERTRELLVSGEMGAPEQVHVSVYASRVFGPHARPPHGDVLDHYGMDALFLLDRLFGPVASVEASGHQLYGEGFDEAHARLVHRSGFTSGLDVSWSVPGYPRPATVIEVKTPKGHLLVSDDALEIAPVLAPGQSEAEGTRVTAAELPAVARFDTGGDELWVALDAFARQCRADAAPAADGPLDLWRSVRVVELLADLRRVVSPHGAEGRRS